MKGKMTPKERWEAFCKGQEMDRVLTVPDMGVTMAHFIGVDTREYYHSAQRMAELEIALFKRLQHDSVGISTTLRGMAEAMGAKIEFPQNSISYLERPIVEAVEQIERLKIANPYQDGKLPILLEAISLTQKALSKEVDVSAAMSGPISVAASVLGTKRLLKWMIKEPKALHQVMEVITESNNRYIDAVSELGVSIGFADPLSSTMLISPKQFREFSKPYLRKNAERILQKTGQKPGIHICGKSRGIWEDVVELGISNFSIDNIEDLEEAKEKMGDKVMITGNVPPVDVVLNGNKEDIFESVKRCIQKGHNSPKGFILSTGCQIPIHTPIEKVDWFMEAAWEYGKYPLDFA